jgi:hypothetical protein
LEGDQALAGVLRVHGLVMNGGVGHLLAVASSEEIATAIWGFRFFSLDEVSQILETAAGGEPQIERATRRYGELVDSDDILKHRFAAVFGASPEAFAPLEALPCPACGFLTLSGEVYGSYEICPVCGWEDDGVQLANPACGGGANHTSLIDAQARTLQALPPTVTEHKGHSRSRSWRPMNQREVDLGVAERARKYWLNRAVVSRWECYWNGGRPLPRDFPMITGQPALDQTIGRRHGE